MHFIDPKLPVVGVGLQDVQNDKNELKQELFFNCTSEEMQNSVQFEFFQFIWFVNNNVSFTSEIVYKTNLSNGYFYEQNGIHHLGIKVCLRVLCKRVTLISISAHVIVAIYSKNIILTHCV